MEHRDIRRLKDEHPSMKLLNATNSPLIISFFYQQFKVNDRLTIPKDELSSSLSNYIRHLENHENITIYQHQSDVYLDDWADSDYLFSRITENDQVVYELTHHTEKVLDWVKSLLEVTPFVSTESRFLKIVSTLKELAYKSTEDKAERLKYLEKQKQAIELEIAKTNADEPDILTDTQIKERYIDTHRTINDMLRDFKQIEHNLHKLDENIRKKILHSDVQKSELLDDLFMSENDIRNTDQGQSFNAFLKLLQARDQMDELDKLIEMVVAIPQIQEIKQYDSILEDMIYKLNQSASKVKQVNDSLIAQLNIFFRQKTYLEHNRMMEMINNIESLAFDLKNNPPSEQDFIEIGDNAEIEMVMSKPLWSPPTVARLRKVELSLGSVDDIDTSGICRHPRVDQKELKEHIHKLLETNSQISLRTIIENHPIERGLAEVFTYFDIVKNTKNVSVYDNISEMIIISDRVNQRHYRVEIPRVIFNRN